MVAAIVVEGGEYEKWECWPRLVECGDGSKTPMQEGTTGTGTLYVGADQKGVLATATHAATQQAGSSGAVGQQH